MWANFGRNEWLTSLFPAAFLKMDFKVGYFKSIFIWSRRLIVGASEQWKFSVFIFIFFSSLPIFVCRCCHINDLTILQKLPLHVEYYSRLFFICPLSADTTKHKSNIVDAYIFARLRRYWIFCHDEIFRFFLCCCCRCSEHEDVKWFG